MDWLLKSTGIEEALLRIFAILFALTAMVVILFVLTIWAKFQALPPGARFLAFVLIGLAVFIAAMIGGWVAAGSLERAGVPTSVASLLHRVDVIWNYFDGWTRTHRWVGVLLLVALPVLVWPYEDD